MSIMPQPTLKKRKPPWLFFFLLLFLSAAGFAAGYIYPSFIQVEAGDELHLIYEDTDLGAGRAALIGGDIYLPIRVVQENLDPELYWEAETGKVVVTTKDKVVRMATEEVSARVNDEEVTLVAPVVERDGEPWMPIEFLAPLYNVDIGYFAATERVVITERRNRQRGTVQKEVRLRQAPGWRSPWIAELKPGDLVDVYTVNENYRYVRTLEGGLLGYIPTHKLSVAALEPEPEAPVRQPGIWQPESGEKINLTWEYVGNRNPRTADIPAMTGVNVVSPTWFNLDNEAGQVANRASSSYVSWAHDRGYQVWALFSNDFDKDLTHAVLSSAAVREKVIDQLLVYAELYHLDGINIDFENVYLYDKQLLVQFARELVPLAHQQGLVVSMDITVRGGSANYSLFLDRQALAQSVDYLALMTYDEHWASSPVAGSVASLPWVENGLRGVLEEVPPEKLLLGVPFYTRLWIETPQQDGSVSVKSQALSMAEAEQMLDKNRASLTFDQAAGQHYAYWERGGVVYEIWLENEDSVRSRAQLVNKYGLAGIASWRRGFEKEVVWEVIAQELSQK